ncbi:hypothetical protein SARC_02130 [Sphaeroforma arctica JP610]|uniref:3'-5' exonuclease domain-containing protein n=1 Tax=Sphaeroforma arctica JP610 TaxID=667725 RepID=A0A0L0G9Y2_9EUKA|nr:hypothetical protein SARC_02130 [Sphaeroforma arctica JP610]KNC85681.1 hypothetical protein SARC_02130 [Sphaeroforma arctica JP610]|eukprot:XP_014159583.1 hypothetical protein SARC_02130 [Sphaeroforma arctica JP610]
MSERASAGQIRRASGRSNTAHLRELVESGWTRQDLDNMANSQEGKGALHLAAWQGSLGSIDYLVEELGCDINVIARGKYSYGKTPIFFATTRNRNTMVRHLLQKGANVKVVNNKGQSVLSIASSHLTPETIALVREAEERQTDIEWTNYRKTHSDGEVYGDLDPRFLERPIRATDVVTDLAVNPTTRKSRLESYSRPDNERANGKAHNKAQKRKGEKKPTPPSAELLIKYERVWEQLCGVLKGVGVSTGDVLSDSVNVQSLSANKKLPDTEIHIKSERARKVSIMEYGVGADDNSIACIVSAHSVGHSTDIVGSAAQQSTVASDPCVSEVDNNKSLFECEMAATTLAYKAMKSGMFGGNLTEVRCVSIDSNLSEFDSFLSYEGDKSSTDVVSVGSGDPPTPAANGRDGLYTLASQFGNLDINVEPCPVSLDTALISAAVPLFVQIVQLEDALRRPWIPTATTRLQGTTHGVVLLDTAIAYLEMPIAQDNEDSDADTNSEEVTPKGQQVGVMKPGMCERGVKCTKVVQAVKESTEIMDKTVSELAQGQDTAGKVSVECRTRDLVLLKKWQQHVYKEHESDSTTGSPSPQLTRKQRQQRKQSLDEFNTTSDWKRAREALKGLTTELLCDSAKSGSVLTLPSPATFVDGTSDLAQLEERLYEHIRRCDDKGMRAVVAFDTEWAGEGDDVGLATIQLAVGNTQTQEHSIESWIVDLLSEEIEDDAQAFLSWLFVHSGVLLVGFAIGHDLNKLNLFLHRRVDTDDRLVAPSHTHKEPNTSECDSCLLDLQTAARVEGLKTGCMPGLKKCCQHYISNTRALDKREQRSDWARRPLSASQLEYAGLDAAVLLVLLSAMDRRIYHGDS